MEEHIKTYSIYFVKNLVNDKIYIGRTTQKINERMAKHFSGAKNGTKNTKFHQDIRKYGKFQFVYKILEICYDEKDAEICEVMFTKAFNSIELGYNTKLGNDMTEEYKKELVESMTGKRHISKVPVNTQEWKDRVAKIHKDKNTGVAMSKEHIDSCVNSVNKIFTNDEIKYILESQESCEVLGKKYKVSRKRIGRIRRSGIDKLTIIRVKKSSYNTTFHPIKNVEARMKILTDEDIKNIKESNETCKKLSEIYKISDKRIGFICRNGFDKLTELKKWETIHGNQQKLDEYKKYILETYKFKL